MQSWIDRGFEIMFGDEPELETEGWQDRAIELVNGEL